MVVDAVSAGMEAWNGCDHQGTGWGILGKRQFCLWSAGKTGLSPDSRWESRHQCARPLQVIGGGGLSGFPYLPIGTTQLYKPALFSGCLCGGKGSPAYLGQCGLEPQWRHLVGRGNLSMQEKTWIHSNNGANLSKRSPWYNPAQPLLAVRSCNSLLRPAQLWPLLQGVVVKIHDVG